LIDRGVDLGAADVDVELPGAREQEPLVDQRLDRDGPADRFLAPWSRLPRRSSTSCSR